MQGGQGVEGCKTPAGLSLIYDREETDLVSLPRKLKCHLVGDDRAKGVAPKVEWSRGLVSPHCRDVARGDLADGVGQARFGPPANPEKGPIGAHMHGEAMQVHHVAADPVNTEERRTTAVRLKRHDRIVCRLQRLVIPEQLRKPRDGQATGKHVNDESSAEPGFDGCEQAEQRERIAAKVEKVGFDVSR